MKKTANILLLAGAALLLSVRVSAQGPEDLLRFSQYNWSYGTARSAAMGGAFSSLGADLSSMMLNPAGLGMYRRSEIGFSPSFTTLKTNTNHYEMGAFSAKDSKNRFALNNIGAAFNLYNSSGSLTSVTLGVAYNKLIDHNSNMKVVGRSPESIARMFALQMETGNYYPWEVKKALENKEGFNRFGGMLGTLAQIVAYDDDEDVYFVHDVLSDDAITNFNLKKTTNGSTGQFDLALGMNFSNVFYLGLGFGFQDIYYKEKNIYEERIENNKSTSEWALDRLDFYEDLKQTGSAWNFKIGTIIRPVEELRIGLTFHTPTYITMDQIYGGDVQNDARSQNAYSGYFDLSTRYRIRTPMRFIGGISYTFYNTAILSLDYERVWYNQMKLFSDDWDNDFTEVTEDVKAAYKPTNNIRAGLEVNVAPNWFARVGFAYYDSMYKDEVLIDESAFKRYDGRKLNYSGGFGYRTGTWGVDLAYIYMDIQDAPKRLFGFAQGDNYVISSAFRADRQRHNVTATLSWRF